MKQKARIACGLAWWCLTLLCIGELAQTAEEPPAGPLQPHPCIVPEKVGTVQFKPGLIWRLVLQDGEIGVKTKKTPIAPREPLNLTLFERDGVFTGAYAAPEKAEEWGRIIRYVNVEDLRREGDVLKGKATVVNNYETHFFPRLTYEVEAKIANGQVAGTYKVTDGGYYLCANPGAVGLTGRVVGKVLDDATAGQSAPPWIAGADWPCWRGPQGNGTAVSVPGKTIANWTEATPLWWSEAFLLSTHSDHSEGAINSSFTSPVVADGRVFFHVGEPDPYAPPRQSVDPKDKRWLARGGQIWPKKMDAVARASLLRDVVYCFDAQTGRTLWKRIEAPQAIYPGHGHASIGLLFSSPCVSGGRVYVQQHTDVVACLDAKTGELVWQSSLDPERTADFERQRAEFVAGKGELPRERNRGLHVQAHFAVVDGVLVCPREDMALIGLDAVTGKQLWITPKAYKGHTAVSMWKHDGQEYALTGDTLLEAKTGKILWRVDNEFGIGVTANATHMMGYRPLTMYEISPEAAKSVWTIGDEKPITHNGQTAGVICGDSFINLRRRVDSRVVTKRADGSWQLSSTYPHQLSGIGASVILNDLILPAPEGEAKKDVNGPLLVRHDPAKGLVVQGPPLLLEQTIGTSMAVASGRMFLRVPGGIVCYDLRATPKPSGEDGHLPHRNEVEAGAARNAEGQTKAEEGSKP